MDNQNKGKLTDLIEALIIALNNGIIEKKEAIRLFANAIISLFKS